MEHPHAPGEPSRGFLDVNGFAIHYQRQGSGSRLILLLHGSFLSLRSWRQVAGPLAAQSTVVAFDRPVFGQTSRPLPSAGGADLYSAAAQSDLVAALIGALGFSRALLVGNSTGGTIALLTALRHPQCVEALVLADAMVYSGYATSQVPAPVLALMRALKPGFRVLMGTLIRALYDPAMRKFWHRQERFSAADLAAYRADFMHGQWQRAFIELFLATRRLGLAERLGAVQVPSLVITGAHDRAVKPAESRQLAAALPRARLVEISDCGHLPQEERPDAFLAAVRSFIAELPLEPDAKTT